MLIFLLNSLIIMLL